MERLGHYALLQDVASAGVAEVEPCGVNVKPEEGHCLVVHVEEEVWVWAGSQKTVHTDGYNDQQKGSHITV